MALGASKSERAKLIRRCDDLWKKFIKERAKGVCEWCGKPGRDAHHMVGRRRSIFLRHKPENGVFVCVSCHFNFHNMESDTGWELFKTQRPECYSLVRLYKNASPKVTTTELLNVVEFLKGLVAE